ncbi:MAG: zinc-binding alcohol dehydrogenase [Beijerinckiaceae bacterium]|nr:zinc-binding alcohol dehydrogenase [Beijerinckiaceae bacterium]
MTTNLQTGPIKTRALWYVAPRECALNELTIAAQPGEALVRTLFSGISRGTERLIFEGRVPASEHERMRGPGMEGAFPFPVKYGYCAVGIVEAGPSDMLGRHVFALHPHQARFWMAPDRLTLLPDSLPPRRAVLAANAETALNALWDAGAGPGDRIAVVGAGVVGLLVAAFAARLPGADVSVVDVDAARAPLAAALGCRFSTDGAGIADCDLVVHTSASAAGLNKAVSLAGFEGTIIELSWHGSGETPVALGGAFHSRRLKLISSQVGHVADSRRARWSYARRMAKALELLADERLDALISADIPFAEAPLRLPALFAPGSPHLTAVLSY